MLTVRAAFLSEAMFLGYWKRWVIELLFRPHRGQKKQPYRISSYLYCSD